MVEACGQSGGLWILRQNGSNVSISIFDVFADTITIQLNVGEDSWLFTGVYASPIYTNRLQLWDHLISLHDHITEPWLLMGDFNKILFLGLVSK